MCPLLEWKQVDGRVYKYLHPFLTMKIRKPFYFWGGIVIGIFLILSYFIKIEVDSGSNFVTRDSLLGILIFHSPWMLGFDILVVLGLIYYGSSIAAN